jgi:hypothetical protein
MIKIGIDFSIKSPAVCLTRNPEELVFFCFPRTGTAKEKVLENLHAADVRVCQLPNEKALPKKASIAERERSSLVDAKMQVESIFLRIESLHMDEEVTVGIEGFSFASTGNRLAQISGYQWLLRYIYLTQGHMNPENFYIFSPMTVKATAGKGNYKKEEMIAAFLSTDDPRLTNNPFWLAMKNTPELFQNKKGGWEKPIDDIIDSYWVLRTLELNTKELLKDS